MSDAASPITDVGIGISYGTWAIVGIIVSASVGVAVLIIVGIMVFICWQTKKRRRRLRTLSAVESGVPPAAQARSNHMRILPVRSSVPAINQTTSTQTTNAGPLPGPSLRPAASPAGPPSPLMITEDAPPNYNELSHRSGTHSSSRSRRNS